MVYNTKTDDIDVTPIVKHCAESEFRWGNIWYV
jgi:hypothetical protein